MPTKRQLILILGAGGSRKEFIVGWLGKLSQFDDTNWTIDLTTGCSNCIDEFKELDTNQTITDVVQRANLDLDSAATRLVAGGCHGWKLHQAGIETYIDNQSVRPFYIDISTADIDTIHWEFIAKTWLTNRRWKTNINRSVWEIDRRIPKPVVTDQDRILATIEIIKNYNSLSNPVFGTKLDYNKLFCAGGSYYLCEQLEINATAQEHKFWNAMLPFCQSPDEITCWGHVWRKQDYFNKFM